jgi:hypothetical protein
MKTRLVPFNIYLLLLLLAVLPGCKTPEERKKSKEITTLSLFLENKNSGSSHTTGGVPVYRANPVYYSVEHEPFLTEGDLDGAEVIESRGGFAIRAQFNGHAAMVLEGVTVAHMGQHIVVQCHFDENRWLAAPLINRRITNGEFTFTPDATREEAERIVRGLSNAIKKIKKKESFWGI